MIDPSLCASRGERHSKWFLLRARQPTTALCDADPFRVVAGLFPYQLHEPARVLLYFSFGTKLPPAFVVFALGSPSQILANGSDEFRGLIRADHDGIWQVLYSCLRRRQNLDDFSIQVALPDFGQCPARVAGQSRAKNKYIERRRLEVCSRAWSLDSDVMTSNPWSRNSCAREWFR